MTTPNETGRAAGQYFAAKAPAVWTYGTRDGQVRYTVDGVQGWKAAVHFKLGKRVVSATWRIRDGAWLEKSGGAADDHVVLPAKLYVGTRWRGPSSFERNGNDASDFEVLALDAQVEAGADGKSWEPCVAVLETSAGGKGPPLTHYYAANVGKVAVREADTWLLKLVEFRPGRYVHEAAE
ncbi:MAG: hypothetical protein K1X64_17290 [Myxococcaceae bacterium]|nr:hypothetical protein [Myxococcaceae bacterium]